MNNQRGYAPSGLLGISAALGFLLFLILAALGWIMNIVKIFALIGCDFSTEIFVRVIFVFLFPLGAVAGWFPVQVVC